MLDYRKVTFLGRERLRKMNSKNENDFTEMLIHDLKGPLSEITANLDILSYTVLEKNREFVKAAQAGCTTLLEMISTLLDIHKFEEGSLKLIKERVCLLTLLNKAVSKLHGVLKIRNIKVTIISPVTVAGNILNNTGNYINCDKNILLRIFQNLLINAIEHSLSGDNIKIGYKHTKNNRFLIYIQDNSPQIPLKYHKTIFEKYQQLYKKNGINNYSTGLGLTFCKLAVEAHNGEIFIDNNCKKGNCFKIII